MVRDKYKCVRISIEVRLFYYFFSTGQNLLTAFSKPPLRFWRGDIYDRNRSVPRSLGRLEVQPLGLAYDLVLCPCLLVTELGKSLVKREHPRDDLLGKAEFSSFRHILPA